MIILYSLIVLVFMAFIFGSILGYSAIKFKVDADPIVDQIDELLPQTQCGQCGYPGCRPYAQAIADGDVITKCIPGGEPTIKAIAQLLGVDANTLVLGAEESVPEKMVAFIDEENCIGCTKCIQACPVDAIAGSTKMLHTVISDYCTGCNLCVAPCPTDCIEMYPIKEHQWFLARHIQRIVVVEVTDKERIKEEGMTGHG